MVRSWLRGGTLVRKHWALHGGEGMCEGMLGMSIAGRAQQAGRGTACHRTHGAQHGLPY